MLGFGGLPQQEGIIRAAAKAGLKYVLPTEYGAPSGNDKQAAASPVVQAKRDDHKLIESLGMKWVGVVTNGWIDYVSPVWVSTYCMPGLHLTSAQSLQYGVYDILIPERKATLYTDSARFSATTIPQVAAAVASFLCLPKSKIDESFANNYLYVSSFVLTQPEIFNSVLRVTGSTEKDWQIERKAVKNCIDEGWELVNGGNPAGHFKILYGLSYSDGMGGEISDLSHNQMLGLEQEDLDAVVKRAVEASRPGGFSAASTLAVPR